jgi:hypothetical protein
MWRDLPLNPSLKGGEARQNTPSPFKERVACLPVGRGEVSTHVVLPLARGGGRLRRPEGSSLLQYRSLYIVCHTCSLSLNHFRSRFFLVLAGWAILFDNKKYPKIIGGPELGRCGLKQLDPRTPASELARRKATLVSPRLGGVGVGSDNVIFLV